MQKVNIFWFRRDLRLEDNTGLYHALSTDVPVIPVFIFDEIILEHLQKDDPRLNFIHETLSDIHKQLKQFNSSLLILHGKPEDIWKQLTEKYDIDNVFINKDYEPYALKRDTTIYELLKSKGIDFKGYKDQVIFEKNEILKKDGKPYTVYTPYKKQWLKKIEEQKVEILQPNYHNFLATDFKTITLSKLGFTTNDIKVLPINTKAINDYGDFRDFPSKNHTSKTGPHFRFGTISVRQWYLKYKSVDDIYISELIWREFFMQILYHFPKVIGNSFKTKYEAIPWLNDEKLFKKWCDGKTGYPIVDAGMRELNQTGYMHNRVRMVVASFLCKHLLTDWRWGEAYFAEKLLDFDLSANNGNWQWAAGCGCDAAPYFRVFNPTLQTERFDKQLEYITKWVPEVHDIEYTKPIVEHKFARNRAIETYKTALNS